MVVAGNADEDEHVLEEVGRSAASRLRHYLSDGSILAVTGGGTIAKVARYLPQGSPMDVTVLPARGGVGRKVETQALSLIHISFFSPTPHDVNLGSRYGVRRQLPLLWTFTTD